MPTNEEQSFPSHCYTSSSPNDKQGHLTVMRHRNGKHHPASQYTHITEESLHTAKEASHTAKEAIDTQKAGAYIEQKKTLIYNKGVLRNILQRTPLL